MLSFEGRNEMIAELNGLRAELEAMDFELEPITRRLLEARGISNEMVQAEANRLRVEHGD